MTDRIAADASATRAFFIDWLTRDIDLVDAILDLVDNSVDAARRHATGSNVGGYFIRLAFDDKRFRIEDNCGGIPVNVARDYAFRIGGQETSRHSRAIGRFGIGMKRAIFRLGSHFRVESITATERFSMEVHLPDWRTLEGNWEFPMDVDPVPKRESEEAGTVIEVTALHGTVVDRFRERTFEDELASLLAKRHELACSDGLGISVNGEPVNAESQTLVQGQGLAPTRSQHTFQSPYGQVELRLVAGFAPDRRSTRESGWYVYCNGRLVLEADKTRATGWGIGASDDNEIPAWHPQYARFRGFAFFDADDPAALPWTTTKSEIDVSSPVYGAALTLMQTIIRQFVRVTNRLKQEREDAQDDTTATTPLSSALEAARPVAIGDVPEGTLQFPEETVRADARPSSSGLGLARISFTREEEKVARVKEAFGLRTNREVGERAFDYLYREEIED